MALVRVIRVGDDLFTLNKEGTESRKLLPGELDAVLDTYNMLIDAFEETGGEAAGPERSIIVRAKSDGAVSTEKLPPDMIRNRT